MAQPRRLRGGGRAPVLLAFAPRVHHRARGVDERARGAARERAGDVRRRRPLGSDAGQEQDRLRQQLARLSRSPADTWPRRPRRRSTGRSRRRAPRRARARAARPAARAAGRRRASRSWTSALPAFEVFTSQKIPPPPRRQAATKGSSESRPRYVLTVSASASGPAAVAGLEVRVRVGAGGRADVAALAVDDHEQPGRSARTRRRARTRRSRRRPSASKNASCGFTPTTLRRDRVDDPAAEPRGRLGGRRASDVGVAAELERQQVEPGIESDDELAALLLDRLRDPVGKGGGRDRCSDSGSGVTWRQSTRGPLARPSTLTSEEGDRPSRRERPP